jgi:PIN domain
MAGRSYLLDTNILSHLVRQPQGSVAARIAAAGEENVLTSIIVACELRYGAAKRGSRRLTRQIEAILGAITILPLEARRRPPLRCHSHDPGKEEDADQGERHAHCGPGSEARLARDWRFDGAVIVSFAVLYLLGAILMCGMLVRRYADRGASVWVVAVVLSFVAVTLIGIQLLALWSMTAEMIRLGNDHMGASRAAKSPWFDPWHRHFGALFIPGVLVFWIVAWLRSSLGRQGQGSSEAGGPQGVVLH